MAVTSNMQILAFSDGELAQLSRIRTFSFVFSLNWKTASDQTAERKL